MTVAVVETAGLRKRFGTKVAVAELSLRLERGEVLGFLGPNGAGKTTSLKMLLGLIEPTAGSGTLLGRPLGDRIARAKVGFLPEHFRFHDWLTGREFLDFHGRLFGLGGARLKERIATLLERVALVDAADRMLRTYSKGMLQRVGLAQALLAEPEVVFLDEPTSGLDPLGRRLVRDVIGGLRAAGTAVFLNSHLLGEVELTCDRVVFFKEGRTVGERRLGREESGLTVELRFEPHAPETLAGLAGFGRDLQSVDGVVRLRVEGEDALPSIASYLVGRGARLYGLHAARPSLEATFLEIMGGDQRPG